MNRIFKVVWNKARGCYMAVYEYAKSQTKSCSTAKLFANKRAAKLAVAMMAVGVMTMGVGMQSVSAAETSYTIKDEAGRISIVKTYEDNMLVSSKEYSYKGETSDIDKIVYYGSNGEAIANDVYTYNTSGTYVGEVKQILRKELDTDKTFTYDYGYNATTKTVTTKEYVTGNAKGVTIAQEKYNRSDGTMTSHIVYVDGVQTSKETWDDAGRLLDSTQYKEDGKTALAQTTYKYNTDGNVTSYTEKKNTKTTYTYTNEYDTEGNLQSTTKKYYGGDGKTVERTEVLNALGNVTELQLGKTVNVTASGEVKTGNLTVGDEKSKKNLTVNGTTALNGNTTVTGTTTLNGNTNVKGTLTVGSKDVNKNLVVNGNVTANTIRVNSHMIHTEGGSIVNESSNNMSFIINGAMSTINGDSNTILSGSYSSIGGKDNSKETSVNYSTLINTNLVRLEQPFSTIMSSDRVIVTGKNLDKDGNLLAGHSVALAACHTNIKEYYGATITSKNVEAAGYNSTVIGSFGTGYKNEAGDYDFFNIKASGKHSTIIGASAYTGLRDRTEESKEASEASGSVEAVGEYSTILGASANDGMDITAGTTENGYAVILGAEADKDNVAATGSHSSLINVKDSSATGDYSTVIGSSNVKTEAKYSAIIASDPVEIKAGSDFSVILGSEGVAEDDSATTYINGTHGLIAGSKDSTIDGNYGVVLGSQASSVTGEHGVVIGGMNSTAAKNALAFGVNTSAIEGGVALGAGAVANRKAGVTGANPLGADMTENPAAWTSTAAAVSVGGGTIKDKDGNDVIVTRQITNVSAGSAPTDAVNVAQLAASKVEIVKGTNVTSVDKTLDPTDGHEIYTVNVKDTTYRIGEGVEQDGKTKYTLVDSNGNDAGVVVDTDTNTTYNFDAHKEKITVGDEEVEVTSIKITDSVNGDKAATYIAGGVGVSIEYDENNNTFKINAEGGGSDPTTGAHTLVTVDGDKEVPFGKYSNGNIQVKRNDNEAMVFDFKLNNNLDLSKDGSIVFGRKDGAVTINNNGLTIKNGPSITKNGIDAGNMNITNVARGEADNDAVNVKQLKEAKTKVKAGKNVTVEKSTGADGEDVYTINAESAGVDQKVINKINNNVNKVGARAAALAALHPMDFDPDDKLNFAAGYGHYKGENAGAIGAFYRPDEKVMFSVGGTVAEHDTMINAGVSFSLDRTSRQTNTKAAMARDIIDLKAENAEMRAQIQQLINQNNMFMNAISQITGLQGKPLDTSKIVMFPDVPANHWAYEYIEGLQKLGIIEGYPDGNFSGDRSCTRYEFAAMLFRALRAGQVIPEALANEFKAELGRFRVDRVHGADDSNNKIERIRVNGDHNYGRDNYGSMNPQPVTSRGPQYNEADRISK